jgi:hypothetical protein
MSAKIRRAGVRGVKLLAASLFVFLMLFNIQLAFDTGSVGDISLLGLKLSAFVPSAVATSPGQQCQSNCGFNDCCSTCWLGGAWGYKYDYTSTGCGRCPCWCC